MATDRNIQADYEALKGTDRKDYTLSSVTQAIMDLTLNGHDVLTKDSSRVGLTSKIPGKTYVAFKQSNMSRPINNGLFISSRKDYAKAASALVQGKMTGKDKLSALYTMAMSFCAANDVLKKGDKKTPGTFFEILIGNLFARQLGVTPTTTIPILSGDMEAGLPTDFIFDLGKKKIKFHVPIKLSTRERVIQVWAHQRVVDGVYGVGRYMGLLTVMSETKLDTAKLEVTEICLPDQWRIYQMYISQLTRIYYLDIPDKYAQLAKEYPKIEVKTLDHFFLESGNF